MYIKNILVYYFMPLGSLKSVNNIALKQLRITANITSASFQQVSVRGQVTITNVTGLFKTYKVFNNSVQIATNISTSSYTITGLGDNVQIGPITIVGYYGNNIPGNTFTVTGGSGGGKIYTPAALTSLTTSSIGCYRATINMVGTWNNLYISYIGGTASPASGFYTTANTYTFTSMLSNVTYTFTVKAINGDQVYTVITSEVNALTAYYTISGGGTNNQGSFAGYNYIIFLTGTSTVTFFNQSFYVETMFVAGGGGGGSNIQVNGAGGGGGGGLGIGQIYITAGQGYAMTSGIGTIRTVNNRGTNGGNSIIVSPNINIFVQGGGGGGGYNGSAIVSLAIGASGGSGGGGGYSTGILGGAPAIIPIGGGTFTSGWVVMNYYGNNGATSAVTGGGGGGGAGAVGNAGNGNNGGNGGVGVAWYLNGSNYGFFAGGGGGVGKYLVGTNGIGGNGGGGSGSGNNAAVNGTANTGGGGGGGNNGGSGGAGATGRITIAFY